jgi:DNA mismatch repair protein MutS
MGDFYEVFFDDAKLLSETCDLALTARHKDSDSPVPMAGVPWHAAETYIRRLIHAGHNVAICEQLEEPSASKGIVRRGVVKVWTPGTWIDAESVEERANHFLVAIAASSLRAADVTAVAALDVSTGDFRLMEVADARRLESELRRLQPAEIVVLESQAPLFRSTVQSLRVPMSVRPAASGELARVIRGATSTTLAQDERGVPALSLATSALRHRIESLRGAAVRDERAAEQAIALVLDYTIQTHGGVPSVLGGLQIHRSEDHLVLDPATMANLEIFETLMGGRRTGSLFSTIDRTFNSAR